MCFYKRDKQIKSHTLTTPSLADKTRISEQETTPGHSLSIASLISSMYLKFLIPKLLSISFSDKDLLVESKSSEASHDCHPKNPKEKCYSQINHQITKEKKNSEIWTGVYVPGQHSHGRCF